MKRVVGVICVAFLMGCGGGTKEIKNDPVYAAHISAVTEARLDELLKCYEEQLKKDPEMFGTVTLRFTIGEDGEVRTARTVVNELNEQTGECMVQVFRTLKFEPSEQGVVTYEYPFEFTPKKD